MVGRGDGELSVWVQGHQIAKVDALVTLILVAKRFMPLSSVQN